MSSDEEFFDQSESDIIIQTPPYYQSIHNFMYGYMNEWSCHTSPIGKILSIGTCGSIFLYCLVKLALDMRQEFDLLKGPLLFGKSIVTGYVSGLIYPVVWIMACINVEFKISYP